MKDKNKKRLDEVKKYIDNLKQKQDISENDVAELSNLLDEAVNGTKIEKLIRNILAFVCRFVALFVFSMLVLGVLFNNLVLENNYYCFYVGLGTGFVLAIADSIPLFSSKGINMLYFIFMLMSILIGVIINDVIKIFDMSSMWIVYIIIIELFYHLLKFNLAKRALGKLI